MLSDFSEVISEGSPDQKLLAAIDWDRLPRHVAIIMDGNGRWAAQRGQPRIAGHRAGVEAVRAAVDTGARLGLGALTLYAFSTENWKRPRYEVDALMRMLRRYLRLELDEIDKQNIRFRTSGELRISNFLLWQSAYAEIYVTETLWPDFRRVHLLEAIADYQGRNRRFGGLKLVVNAK